MFERDKKSLANRLNNNTNNAYLRKNSTMQEHESELRLIEINNLTINSNFNTNRKESEIHLNNRQVNITNSKNGSEAIKRKLYF